MKKLRGEGRAPNTEPVHRPRNWGFLTLETKQTVLNNEESVIKRMAVKRGLIVLPTCISPSATASFAPKGRREGENGYLLPMIPCASSPVIHVSPTFRSVSCCPSVRRKTKRLRRRWIQQCDSPEHVIFIIRNALLD